MGTTLILRKIIQFVILLIMSTSVFSQRMETINGVNYKITEQRLFLKEDQLWAVYKNYLDSKGHFRFGYLLEATRNDSVFIRGHMQLYKRGKIICTEKYIYDDLFKKDSVQRIYMTNKKKKLLLKQYKEFYKGSVIKNLIFN